MVLLAVMASFASGLTDRLGSGGFEVPGSQSLAVQRDLEQRFANQFPTTALVTVHDGARTVDDPAFKAVVEGIATRVEAVPNVGGVESFVSTGSPAFVSPDRHTTYLVVGLSGDQNTQLDTAPEVVAAAREGVPAGVEVEIGGAAAFYERMNEISRHDLEQAERVSFPITLVVLLLAFTSLVAAGLPIMLALVSLGVTLGALYFLAGITDMNVYVTNTASIVGIGVGIDYALFVVTRFREELRRGRSVAEAVPVTLATSGRAVALSGATVIVALAGMFLVDIQAFRSMAVGSMSVVAVAVLAAITLLPAVLSLVGHWVDRLRIPVPRPRATEGEGFWHRWAVRIMRRPWAFTAAALAVLLLLAVPFAGIRLGQPGSSILPADESPRLASERLAAEFGAGVTGPMEILVDTPGGAGTRANLERVDRLTRALQADQAVASVQSLTAVLPDANLDAYTRLYAGGLAGIDPELAPAVAGLANWDRGADLARITVVAKDAPESEAAEALLDRVRDEHIPAAGLDGQGPGRRGDRPQRRPGPRDLQPAPGGRAGRPGPVVRAAGHGLPLAGAAAAGDRHEPAVGRGRLRADRGHASSGAGASSCSASPPRATSRSSCPCSCSRSCSACPWTTRCSCSPGSGRSTCAPATTSWPWPAAWRTRPAPSPRRRWSW